MNSTWHDCGHTSERDYVKVLMCHACNEIAKAAVTGELTRLRAVAAALRRFLEAGVNEAQEAWVPGWLSNEYEALVDAWLALPSELRDALAARGKGRGEGG